MVKEPNSPVKAMFASIPLMIFNLLLVLGVIKLFSIISMADFGISDGNVQITIRLIDLVWIIGLVIVHEGIHLMLVPNFLKSNKTVIGITFFGGFVHTEEELSKARFLLISVAPFIILSILLPIFLGLLGVLTPILKFIILLNAIGASVDVLMFILIMVQVPRGAIIRSNGPKTYWKLT
ncbi:DUF3267 domain-containing protein [Bacillus massiliigorillae]|uniref:DUF3267 domain-containing protein n=1 Tax=Bacillus massiliigorillae TaxID=1243664 RepID=UPI0003A37F25|nr:DUF3267 domain-containing protein [Bacillus massiliigorillae]